MNIRYWRYLNFAILAPSRAPSPILFRATRNKCGIDSQNPKDGQHDRDTVSGSFDLIVVVIVEPIDQKGNMDVN